MSLTKKIYQHYIPRVYLKQFQIDNDKNRSFVHCIDFSNKYNLKPQKKGINDKVFKERKYYNDNRLEDPFMIENVLGESFEPKFESIMNHINSETSLSAEIVEDLMTWLFISKLRSPLFRVKSERIMRWYYKMINAYEKKVLSEEENRDLDQYILNASREIHLNTFSDPDQYKNLLELHFETINAKHWRILKSMPNLPFWANDNPGFSPNTIARFAKDVPFHEVMELNGRSIIYYVLSPKYCLEITPFLEGTPLTLCALNMKIKYEQANPLLIAFINEGVFHTRHKLLISNSKTMMNTFIKIQPKE